MPTHDPRALERNEAYLRKTELRQFLTQAELQELERFCRPVTRKAGSTLFRQDEPADCLYVMVDGTAELRAKPPGRRVYRTVEVVGPGCTFGDESVFAEGSYLFSARALEPTKLLVLPREDFSRLSEMSPTMAMKILKCAGSCLEAIVRRSAILTQAPAEVGVQELLRELTASGHKDGGPVAVRMTHAQLAGVLHLSRETVSRILSSMASEGQVGLGRGVIRVYPS